MAGEGVWRWCGKGPCEIYGTLRLIRFDLSLGPACHARNMDLVWVSGWIISYRTTAGLCSNGFAEERRGD